MTPPPAATGIVSNAYRSTEERRELLHQSDTSVTSLENGMAGTNRTSKMTGLGPQSYPPYAQSSSLPGGAGQPNLIASSRFARKECAVTVL